MNEIFYNPLLLLVTAALVALAFLIWIVYRSLKDKNEFEQNMDNPQKNLKHHLKHGEEKT